MCNYISAFKKFLYVFLLVPVTLFSCNGAGNRGSLPGMKTVYNISWDDESFNQRWGEYLYYHLEKRGCEKNMVLCNAKQTTNVKTIRVEYGTVPVGEYAIVNKPDQILLKASSEQSMVWLIYQFIQKLSQEDKRLDASDLPPAIISLDSHTGKFDFEYREPFFRVNLDPDCGPVLGTHSVDRDWAIWGHNLHKVLGDNLPDEVYARSSGIRIRDQYCFSSEELFKRLEQYIDHSYGDKANHSKWFMIMPNDNSYVCLCENCQAIGNTSRSATPAVGSLIKQLAKRFPEHYFFTTAYLSTLLPNGNAWPSNTGVLISTIDMPKGVDPSRTPEAKEFLQLVNRWKQSTSQIYVWDYAANFDDYLTPLPVLYGLSKQFQFYKYHGVKGVFLNASGYDYSPFDDMKTYVAAALLQNNSLPVDSLCRKFYAHYYPVSGKLLADYYLSLEKRLAGKQLPYPLYGGFTDAVDRYLDREEFVSFYDSLGEILPHSKEQESEKLLHLYTALTYPRLQFAWLEKDEVTARKLLPRLKEYKQYPDLINYREDSGELKNYLKSWDYILQQMGKENKLKGKTFTALSRLDEDYKNLSVLTDGVTGFPGNYHQGWLLCNGDDLHLECSATDIAGKGTLTIHFLSNSRHRIHPPQKIEVYKNRQIYKVFEPVKLKDTEQIWYISEKVDFGDAQTLSFKLYRPDSATIACDEIIFN